MNTNDRYAQRHAFDLAKATYEKTVILEQAAAVLQTANTGIRVLNKIEAVRQELLQEYAEQRTLLSYLDMGLRVKLAPQLPEAKVVKKN